MNSNRTSGAARTAKSKPQRVTASVSHPRDLLSRDQLHELYRRILYARYFDSTLLDLKKKARITRGEVYSSRGQEAVIVGTTFPLRPDDYISPVHRDMVANAFKGMSARDIMSQVYGRSAAPGKAKDVWTHFGDMNKGIIPSTSMLASTIPVAAGVAQAIVMDANDSVVVCYNGEGATARGDFHEGLNYAAIHRLPVICVIENNQWAYSTPMRLGCPTERVAQRADGYGIPGVTVDGQNVLDVYDATVEAIERARIGGGPTVIECITWRYHGHATHDDSKAMAYRPKAMIEEWASDSKDPLCIFRNFLLKNGSRQEQVPKEPTPEMVAELQDAVEFALAAPFAAPEEAMLDVYDESAGLTA